MALVVEDGTIVADADSYVALADATAYHAALGNSGWTGTDEVKEQALRKATMFVDNRYGARFKGTRVEKTQSLAWPRSDVADVDGFDVDDDEIPAALKKAVMEAALRVVQGTDLSPDLERGGDIKRTASAVGPISTEVEYMDGASRTTTFTMIEDLLRPVLNTSSGSTKFIERA